MKLDSRLSIVNKVLITLSIVSINLCLSSNSGSVSRLNLKGKNGNTNQHGKNY